MKHLIKKSTNLPFFLFIIIILSLYNSPKVEATVVTTNAYAKIFNTSASPTNPLTIIEPQSVEISGVPIANATCYPIQAKA